MTVRDVMGWRGGAAIDFTARHRHSGLSRSLRFGCMRSRDMAELLTARLTVESALLSRDDTVAEKYLDQSANRTLGRLADVLFPAPGGSGAEKGKKRNGELDKYADKFEKLRRFTAARKAMEARLKARVRNGRMAGGDVPQDGTPAQGNT